MTESRHLASACVPRAAKPREPGHSDSVRTLPSLQAQHKLLGKNHIDICVRLCRHDISVIVSVASAATLVQIEIGVGVVT